MNFTHGSLFSGIGGFDLAAEWMGWQNVFHCEKEPFCQRVLKYHFPNSILHDDIKTTDFSVYRGTIDILTGGFPCQPYSVAGNQKGTEDERHLWPEMRRAIREIQPTFVVGENVPGLVNWNGGLVFEQVQIELETEGYEVIPFLLPAAGVNAPHTRDRIWFIAYACSHGRSENTKRRRKSDEKNNEQLECLHNKGVIKNSNSDGWAGEQREEKSSKRKSRYSTTGNNERISANNDKIRFATVSDSKGFSAELLTPFNDQEKRRIEQSSSNVGGALQNKGWENFATQSPICDGDDGLSGRLDGITFPQWRIKSIMGGGNAIVPQVALQIFKAIEQYTALI